MTTTDKIITRLHRLADNIDRKEIKFETERTDGHLDALVSAADAALASAEDARAALVEKHRQELAMVDGELSAIRAGLRSLRSQARARKRPSHVQAGPHAMRLVVEVLSSGTITQKEIVKKTKLNEGTVSHAISALLASESVELTGRRVSGSRELRLIPGRREIAAKLYEEARQVIGSGRGSRV